MKKVIFLIGGLLFAKFSFGQVFFPNSGGADDAGNASGTTDIHIGGYAGSNSLNNASANVFIGYESGLSNTSGFSNVYVGFKSGFNNVIGTGNVFLGSMSGEENVAAGNVFLGYRSGDENVNGLNNTFVGYASGVSSEGSYNTFLGDYSGSAASGSGNVCVGHLAGNKSGVYNVYMGYETGLNTLGDNNVFIGRQAGKGVVNGSNKLYIANSSTNYPLVYGEFDNKHLKFNANKVGIGTEFGDFPTLTFDNAENYRFFVRGGILAEEMRVRIYDDWADYVFDDDYKLLSLKETEKFIDENGHLPNMPSAEDVKEEGLEIGNIIKLQQEKIEELTLHTIAQDKKLNEQDKEIELLKSQMQILLSKQ